MHHYMPEIFYHDRKALLSVDIHPVSKNGHYKIVTSSVQQEIRLWDFFYETAKEGVYPIVINFIANLEGHNAAINQVKFSQNPECNLLASGDVHGRIAIWQLSAQPSTAIPLEEFPPNKENWQRIKVIGRLEISSKDVYCTYIFKRWELEKDRPAVILPSPLPTFCIKFCPIMFDLDKNYEENYSGLPYRLIWLALTRESIIFYDSQHSSAIALVENISYNNISDASWSIDGRNVVISSMEGYCHYLKFNIDSLGVQVQKLPECPESPHFVKRKPKKERKKVTEEEKEILTPAPVTPNAKTAITTPKSATPGGLMLRYLKKPTDESPVSSRRQPANAEENEPKAKKRISIVSAE